MQIISIAKKLQNQIQDCTCNEQGLEIDDDDLPWLPVATPLDTARKYSQILHTTMYIARCLTKWLLLLEYRKEKKETEVIYQNWSVSPDYTGRIVRFRLASKYNRPLQLGLSMAAMAFTGYYTSIACAQGGNTRQLRMSTVYISTSLVFQTLMSLAMLDSL